MAVWAEQSATDNYSFQLTEEILFKFLIEFYFVPDKFYFFIGEFRPGSWEGCEYC